jgi:hypothetical protein
MKNSKLALCFLFVTIVSNNCFSKDTVITNLHQMAYKVNKDSLTTQKKYEIRVDFILKKDSIIEKNWYDVVYKIEKNIGVSNTDMGKVDSYYCKDPEGGYCFVHFFEKRKENKNLTVMISYKDINYYYFSN